MGQALARWVILVIAIWAVTYIPWLGIQVEGWPSILIAALFLGLVNTFVKPVLMLISLPFILFTFGLFIWVINAGLLCLVSWVMGDAFVVPSFWSALGASLVISLISLLLGSGSRTRVMVGRSAENTRRRPPPGDGPVIDI